MATLRRLANGLAIALTIAYPPAVYFGLQVMQPRVLGLLLLSILLLRHWQTARQFMAGVERSEWIAFAALCCLALGIMITNQVELLLLYPVAVSVSLLFVFGRSLIRPPSMIERIARLSEPDLPSEGIRYTRQVTWVWCAFFTVNGAIALVTAFASREYWALYNGLVSYILMGLLFAVEWLVRGRIRRRHV
jgi:uncharacterized membrane protein